MEKPEVNLKDWVVLGSRDAVVCQIYNSDFIKNGIEIVFLDVRNRAINIDVFWNGGKWEPVKNDGSGGYADNYTRLNEFVRILRNGKI